MVVSACEIASAQSAEQAMRPLLGGRAHSAHRPFPAKGTEGDGVRCRVIEAFHKFTLFKASGRLRGQRAKSITRPGARHRR